MRTIDKARNSAQRAKGKVEEVAGRATGNDRLRFRGKAHQFTARLKQTGERVKDALNPNRRGPRRSAPNRQAPTPRSPDGL
jgi:uncharacterized protein YjbJ (UPF0337 family)